MTVEAFNASSIANSLQNTPFLLQVLACSFASSYASTREFVCEYSQVRLRVLVSKCTWFASRALASFDSHVGSAPLACTPVLAHARK